ncbi:MAG: histidine triad nucleotide-binding protein [Pirellulaceae bacterium]|nr:histidine triad nucleotide-binding protein [Pirellulaceae bacterium]
MSDTVFSKIIRKEIPAKIVYEDDLSLAFHDINPKSPVHVLVIPKKPIPSLEEVAPEDQALIGHLFIVVQRIARELGIAEGGYRVVINCRGDGGQEVPHLHLHLLGGKKQKWPPG